MNVFILQVWFQNARAKYRRNLLKQQGGDSSPRDGKNGDINSKTSDSLTELSHDGSRSPGLSDISSTPSLSDLQNSSMECDSVGADPHDMDVPPPHHHPHPHPHHPHHLVEPNNNDSSGTSLTELFSNSIAAMN